MNDEKHSPWATLLALVLMAPLYAFSGYTLHCLWGWFVVTSFEAVSLSVPQCVGLVVIAGFLRGKVERYEPTSPVRHPMAIVWDLAILTGLSLLAGFTASRFM